eukprot:3354267-Prymnesium_polylepis.1
MAPRDGKVAAVCLGLALDREDAVFDDEREVARAHSGQRKFQTVVVLAGRRGRRALCHREL